MGYFYNHLATLVTAVFAAILTVLWPLFVEMAPILNFIFMMAVPISWFLVAMCWLSQKSADYMKKFEASHSTHEKKSLTNTQTTVYSSAGQVTPSQIKVAQSELTNDLDQLKETIKLQDSEIERLKQEIANLQTLVQIESLKTELANLKMLASEKSRRVKRF